MHDETKYVFGVLLVLFSIVSGVVYVTWSSQGLKMRIDKDESKFYALDSGRWIITGIEQNRMFDGNRILYRSKKSITVDVFNLSDHMEINRSTKYIRGPRIVDTYIFRGDITNKELFPISHTVRILNGTGYKYRYTVDRLSNTGDKRKLTGETKLRFGYSMNVVIEPGYKWAWIGWPYGSDSLSAQYHINSDDVTLSLRLYDPTTVCTLDGGANNSKYEYFTNATIQCDGNAEIIVDDNVDVFSVVSGVDSYYHIDTLRQNKYNGSLNVSINVATNISPTAGSYTCYQETANKTYQCGGRGTGEYGFSVGSWIGDPLNIIDENYTSLANAASSSHAYFFVNYTLISTMTNRVDIKWQVRVNANPTTNFSIPEDCKGYTDKVVLQADLFNSGQFIDLECWNLSSGPLTYQSDANWVRISHQGASSNLGLNEEALFWNYTGPIVKMDNRTDIQSASFGISGGQDGSNYPKDSFIHINGLQRYNFRGSLFEFWLTEDRFIDGSIESEAVNVSFGSSGSSTILTRVSSSGLSSVNAFRNLSVRLSGFDIDNGNQLDFTEYFNDTNSTTNLINTSTTASAPEGYYDNFEDNESSDDLWTVESCDSTYNCNFTQGKVDDYFHMWFDLANGNQKVYTSSMSLTNRTRFKMNLETTGSVFFVGGCAYGFNCGVSNNIRVSDGVDNVNVYSQAASPPRGTSDSFSFTGNVTAINKIGTDTWDVYINDVFEQTISTSSLNPNLQWNVEVIQSANNDLNPDCSCTPGSVQTKVFDLKVSGATLDKAFNEANYSTNQSFVSKVIFSAPSNVNAMTLYAVEDKPPGTDIHYYISNDNGSTTTNVNLGIRNTFTTTANDIVIRADLITEDVTVAPSVLSYNAIISPGSAGGVTVDFAADGTTECTVGFELNESTSPYICNATSTSIFGYMSANCVSSETCDIPVVVSLTSDGGIVQLHNLNLSRNVTDLSINNSLVENLETVFFAVDAGGGIIELNNLKFDFLGSKNLSLAVNNSGSIDNYAIQVKYSNFNVTLGQGINQFDIYTKDLGGRTAQNVTPVGQTNVTGVWSIISVAYEDPMDIYVYTNETINSSINVTFGNDSMKTNSFAVILNNSGLQVMEDLQLGTNKSVWNWVDLGNFSGAFYIPYFYWSAICADCVRTNEHWLTNLIET